MVTGAYLDSLAASRSLGADSRRNESSPLPLAAMIGSTKAIRDPVPLHCPCPRRDAADGHYSVADVLHL